VKSNFVCQVDRRWTARIVSSVFGSMVFKKTTIYTEESVFFKISSEDIQHRHYGEKSSEPETIENL